MTAVARRPHVAVLVVGPPSVTRDAVVAVLTAAGNVVWVGGPRGLRDARPAPATAAVAVVVEPGAADWAALREHALPAVVVDHRVGMVVPPADVDVRAVFGVDAESDDVLAAVVDVVSPGDGSGDSRAHDAGGGDHRAGGADRARAGTGAGAAVTLTPRERQILGAIDRGLSVKQTARALGIAPKTVENLQSRLFAKLGARNRAQAVFVAHGLGLLGGRES